MICTPTAEPCSQWNVLDIWNGGSRKRYHYVCPTEHTPIKLHYLLFSSQRAEVFHDFIEDMEATLPSADTNGSGPQNATFSYFRFNPDVHTIEKPFEVLINLPSMEKGQSMNRRTNQEFEDRRMTVHDARGHESDFTLNQNGFCWRAWKELPDWRGTCAEDLQKMGHKRIQEGYIKAVENFIKAQIEEQDGEDVDFVEVFDYKVINHLTLLLQQTTPALTLMIPPVLLATIKL